MNIKWKKCLNGSKDEACTIDGVKAFTLTQKDQDEWLIYYYIESGKRRHDFSMAASDCLKSVYTRNLHTTALKLYQKKMEPKKSGPDKPKKNPRNAGRKKKPASEKKDIRLTFYVSEKDLDRYHPFAGDPKKKLSEAMRDHLNKLLRADRQ